ncbi:MAG: OsmC family protein [Bacteroidales bacterium]|nr:OsmC family protein [Bacteroidales bacterium]
MDTVDIKWNEQMSFIVDVDGHSCIIDAKTDVGGLDEGPRPKPLLLSALGGCTAMDVISILRKMRIEPESFHVVVDGELTDEHPKHYNTIIIKYVLTGENIKPENVKKAVKLSEESYCGVSHVLKKAIEIQTEIHINGEIVV